MSEQRFRIVLQAVEVDDDGEWPEVTVLAQVAEKDLTVDGDAFTSGARWDRIIDFVEANGWPGPSAPPDQDPPTMRELIERSSLGTPGAKALRASVSDAEVADVMTRLRGLDRVEAACVVMHDAYEAAAVAEGWETQERSRKPWAEVPEANKETMRAAVAALFAYLGTEGQR